MSLLKSNNKLVTSSHLRIAVKTNTTQEGIQEHSPLPLSTEGRRLDRLTSSRSLVSII